MPRSWTRRPIRLHRHHVVGPNQTFNGRHGIRVGATPVELIEVGPAHSATDLVVHLPDQAIVAAGDTVFADDHPVLRRGPLPSMLRACRTVLDLGPTPILPGHGRVLDPAEGRTSMTYVGGARTSHQGTAHQGPARLPRRRRHPGARLLSGHGRPRTHRHHHRRRIRSARRPQAPKHVLQLAQQAARRTYGQRLRPGYDDTTDGAPAPASRTSAPQ
ncbi:MBL fold metallo-hydrolase [Streptomyces spectabilis]|uniref:MBL fold metallo-hydrolase n=1 Tax=Streptomyces spectabilis TaxID=68270 RepID=A0A516RJX6_STRST|nr:MBL fold metallo-hydrolase [Streptomyces spectabilis]